MFSLHVTLVAESLQLSDRLQGLLILRLDYVPSLSCKWERKEGQKPLLPEQIPLPLFAESSLS